MLEHAPSRVAADAIGYRELNGMFDPDCPIARH
jgi:hypothetical protein